jgi:hypothetical protein
MQLALPVMPESNMGNLHTGVPGNFHTNAAGNPHTNLCYGQSPLQSVFWGISTPVFQGISTPVSIPENLHVSL